jgi:hypothetical protein
VPQGLFRIESTYASGCCPGDNFSAEAFFDIGVVPVPPVSWGRIKIVFERRSVP